MTGPAELYEFLMRCVGDRGRAALRSIVEFAQNTTYTEVKSPAIAALVCWGEVGLAEIRNIATTDPTSKNVSAALKVLSTVAAGDEISERLMFMRHEPLAAAIKNALERGSLHGAARRNLAELILSLPAEDLLIPLGTAFVQISVASSNSAGELVAALSTKWLQFGPPSLLAYETLLQNSTGDEAAFHQFFIECPQFLDPMAKILWSKPDFHGALQPDFVIRRCDDTYLIVEIEKPSKPLVTMANQLSSEVTQAEMQGNEYRAFLVERIMEAQQHFPSIRDPECLVVIGMESSLNDAQRKALSNSNNSRLRLRTVGFDWLLDRARTILTNVSAGQIKVVSGHRLI